MTGKTANVTVRATDELRSQLISRAEDLRTQYLAFDSSLSLYDQQYGILKIAPTSSIRDARRRVGNLRHAERNRQSRVGNKWRILCEGFEKIFGEKLPAHLRRQD